MSSYDHAKTSKNDLSNRARSFLSSVDKSNPILSSLGWSAESCHTISSFISNIYDVGEEGADNVIS